MMNTVTVDHHGREVSQFLLHRSIFKDPFKTLAEQKKRNTHMKKANTFFHNHTYTHTSPLKKTLEKTLFHFKFVKRYFQGDIN